MVPSFLHDQSNWDLGAWLSKHSIKDITPILDSVIQALRDQGVTTFAATGYCYGGSPIYYTLTIAFRLWSERF